MRNFQKKWEKMKRPPVTRLAFFFFLRRSLQVFCCLVLGAFVDKSVPFVGASLIIVASYHIRYRGEREFVGGVFLAFPIVTFFKESYYSLCHETLSKYPSKWDDSRPSFPPPFFQTFLFFLFSFSKTRTLLFRILFVLGACFETWGG